MAVVLIETACTSPVKEVTVSPGGRYQLVLTHDEYMGQTETLSVLSRPNSRDEREIFRQVGDQPFAFVRWRGDGEAVLKVASNGGPGLREELLHCAADHCTLEP